MQDYSQVRAALPRIVADPLGTGPLWPGALPLDDFYANQGDIPLKNIEPHDWRWVLRQTWPYRLADGIINSAISGVTLARDVMGGKVRVSLPDSRTSPELIRRALDMAGLVGSGPVRKGAAAIGKGTAAALDSRAPGIYDPPVQPPRPFTADYPAGAAADGAGKLTTDIDGRPLGARYVVGRGVVGGKDETIPIQELESLGTAVTGRTPQAGPRSGPGAALQGRDGRSFTGYDRHGRYLGQRGILVANDMAMDKAVRVLSHEIAHVIDMHAFPPATSAEFEAGKWGIQSADATVQAGLKRIYRDLNSPDAPHFGPEDRGYSKEMAPKELWAEAIRAYLTDPNYVKSVAPEVAITIRAAVNTHPGLARIIQFNARGAPLGAMGASGNSQEHNAQTMGAPLQPDQAFW